MKRRFGLVQCVVFVSGVKAASACSSHSPASEGVLMPVATASTAATASPSSSAVAPLPTEPAPSSSAVAAPPASGKMCGGIAGFRCAEKRYCAYSLEAKCGAGDMAGVCKPVPDLCTMEFAPVCGCDGKTYGSTCVAARAGVSIAKSGACAGDSSPATEIAEGKLCGTRGVSGRCAAGLYCDYHDHCGVTDSGGTCTKKPEICNDLFAAVCGCDGKTYPNACHAARAGTTVLDQGACKRSKDEPL